MMCCGYLMLEIQKKGEVVGYECALFKIKKMNCERCGEPATKNFEGESLCTFHYDQMMCDGQGLL